jgi:serine/threonine protein phosphatase PrpC
MDVEFSARTDVGLVRSGNEDNFLIDRKLQLYIVCDGMGGHQAGAVASATAVNVVRDTLVKHQATFESFERQDGTAIERDVCALLAQAVQRANARVYERGRNNTEQRGMGTTLSLLLLARDQVFWAHVGDSRIYRLRSGMLDQLTTDHSLLEVMKTQKPIMEANVFDHRLRNAITRAVGGAPTVEVDTDNALTQPGDVYMLCTDGLYPYYEGDRLAEFMAIQDLDQATTKLVDGANEAGGHDNITAVIVRIPKDAKTAATSDLPSLFTLLEDIPTMSIFDAEQRRTLVRSGVERTIAPGDIVLPAGQAHDALTLIVSGEADSVQNNATKLGPGDFIGLEAVVVGDPSPHAVRARGSRPLRLLDIPASRFRTWAEDNDPLAIRLSYILMRALVPGKEDRLSQPTSQLIPHTWITLPEKSGEADSPANLPIQTDKNQRKREINSTIELDASALKEANAPELPPLPPSSKETTSQAQKLPDREASDANDT